MHINFTALAVFVLFVGSVLAISFYLGSKAKSASGYYAAHGQINWFVNGIAFAGDYLSAASFLGICGMIAFYGYDGFLYSIGFLAGWIVALFVIAEPLKRLGKFTFADALDKKFNSTGIKLTASISTLVVSLFYLIPQMVGAGSLIQPLLGLPHWSGVLIVGVVVILIVVTAGMVSTTYVQFIKGSLLVIFCAILVGMILKHGLVVGQSVDGKNVVDMTPQVVIEKGSTKIVNGVDGGTLRSVGQIAELPGGVTRTGPLGPIAYIKTLQDSKIVTWPSSKKIGPDGETITTYTPKLISGNSLLLPGGSPTFKGVRSPLLKDKLDFFSLMLALFGGTASLPHILIRYYTVKDQRAARRSTVVGIASIGFFYMLTLYLGLGAMTSGAMNLADTNMAAPLLAKTFNNLLFAVITAIAFTTVLGTVSGLIMAASGTVAHDIMTNIMKLEMTDHQKVNAGKWVAVFVGIIAMVLGIVFKKLNVGFLVGWAFNVAASANLPSLIMLLFWKRTTKQGITAAILIGLLSSLFWLLLSGPAYQYVYGLEPKKALAPFSQPGIITIPLGFVVLIVVSLFTQRQTEDIPAAMAVAR